ncbi:hypothetical protein MtrunA17_Chr4g0019131 [Medicago truncatula]|uniref:Uncharacterized protein n=1 Tax=Medicago truncatula TaxID=3880 RepID=A0A396I2N9_MEDTR|nr:hypothetical protein MtrunA17_Chr4g0019131 [Medicago truncatula]
MNAMDLRRGINMDVDVVVTNLKSRARMIDTSEEIAQNIVFDAPTQSLNLEKVDKFAESSKSVLIPTDHCSFSHSTRKVF